MIPRSSRAICNAISHKEEKPHRVVTLGGFFISVWLIKSLGRRITETVPLTTRFIKVPGSQQMIRNRYRWRNSEWLSLEIHFCHRAIPRRTGTVVRGKSSEVRTRRRSGCPHRHNLREYPHQPDFPPAVNLLRG